MRMPWSLLKERYKNHINGYHPNSIPVGDGFMNIPEDANDELPFS